MLRRACVRTFVGQQCAVRVVPRAACSQTRPFERGPQANKVVDFDFSDFSSMKRGEFLSSKKKRRIKPINPDEAKLLENQLNNPQLDLDDVMT